MRTLVKTIKTNLLRTLEIKQKLELNFGKNSKLCTILTIYFHPPLPTSLGALKANNVRTKEAVKNRSPGVTRRSGKCLESSQSPKLEMITI